MIFKVKFFNKFSHLLITLTYCNVAFPTLAVYGVCLLRLSSLPIPHSGFQSGWSLCGPKYRQHGSTIWQGLILICLSNIWLISYDKLNVMNTNLISNLSSNVIRLIYSHFCCFRPSIQEQGRPLNMLSYI